ncbi:DUF2787 domain-containing protein [Psychromonas arctica]|uniref:DUF2787 domain-containing protein n=1 Tax=Psychromonas arctica TaxID=168275 RepID=UPI00040077B0|nr:DUF2787 domain-containing protein [Psychromonas arctica]
MKNIKLKSSPLKISTQLLVHINEAISRNKIAKERTHISINFRDSEYNYKLGGYHPVEIGLEKMGDNKRWSLLYITDFSYLGYPYAELVKELNFDFSEGMLFTNYCPPRPITHYTVKALFELWQHNFISYLEFSAFDQIKVST